MSAEDEEASRLSFLYLKHTGVRYPVVRVNDYRLKIDVYDQLIGPTLYVHGQWEAYESEIMARLLAPGMVFVDVGAHIGYYSLLAARRVGPAGRVLAFEPAPANFALLADNIEINDAGGVIRAEQAALAAYDGEADLYLAAANTGDHRLYPTDFDDDARNNDGQRRPSVRVRTAALDAYLQQQDVTRVDAVKIDAQGSEMGVLAGMRDTLRLNPRLLLFMEFWPYGLVRGGTDPAALLRFLSAEAGMSFLQIRHHECQLTPAGADDLLTQARESNRQIDLLCCREPGQVLAALAGG